MKISDTFPSNYLKAANLDGKNVRVTISRVLVEEIGDDRKPVLYFKDKEKGMVLNKTNANNIAVLYGDETSDWEGQDIVLFPAMVDFQGKTVEAIRVRGLNPREKAAAAAKAPPPKSAHDELNPPVDADIPF